MMGPDPNRNTYLGIRAGDYDGKWYGKYYNPEMVRLPEYTIYALTFGPQAAALCPDLENLPDLTKPGYQQLETGYTLNPDGSMFVAALTQFPKATPAMLDWWFWWFTRHTTRYKLWYPKSHLYAETEAPERTAGRPDRERYIDTVLYIDEYVGSTVGQLRIHWLDPTELGFDKATLNPDNATLNPDNATAICCQIGLSGAPLDWGHLVHYVRRVQGGCEMRVRLWMGGRHVAPRGDPSSLTEDQRRQLGWMRQIGDDSARAMLAHSSQEMTHLASFLPDIYREYQNRGER